MSRYYSYETIRNNAKDVILENGVKHRCIDPDALLDIEPADVRENVRGEWQVTENIEKDCYIVRCSNCHASVMVGRRILYDAKIELNNFCPNCGADMRQVSTDRYMEKNHERQTNI